MSRSRGDSALIWLFNMENIKCIIVDDIIIWYNSNFFYISFSNKQEQYLKKGDESLS